MDEMTRQTFIKEEYTFEDLIRIVWQLRAPDGCPWDKEQTHETLHDCLIEETYEVIEAVNNKDIANMREELGDVMLQVLLHCAIAKEHQEFSFEEVVDELAHKLIRRHPHVFGDVGPAASAEEGLSRWEAVKKEEKAKKASGTQGELSRIPKELPPVMRAKKVMKKAGKLYGTTEGNDELMLAVEQYCRAEECLTNAIEKYIKEKEQ